jgi:hypothetical protein
MKRFVTCQGSSDLPVRGRVNLVLLLATACLGLVSISSGQDSTLSLDHTFGRHSVSWTTRVGYSYRVESSQDLLSWANNWVIEPGTGSVVTHSFSPEGVRGFYRVNENIDLYNGRFLVLPEEGGTVDLGAGVCFSFALGVLDELPGKLHLYQRLSGTAADWELIGTITELAEVDGIRFVRGNSIWLPEATGRYEVLAAAVDADGMVLATATRTVEVVGNEAPSIAIIGGPPSPSESGQLAQFVTEVSDSEDEILRVDFYDNGMLIGTDHAAPFGDPAADSWETSYGLLRGTHQITAKAYDARGAWGETAEPFEVVVTGGNARPSLAIDSPLNGSTVIQGEDLTIAVTLTDADGDGDILRLDARNVTNSSGAWDLIPPFGPLILDTSDWEPGNHAIRLKLTDAGGAENYPHYLRVYVRDPAAQDFAQSLVARIVDAASAAPSNEVFTGVEASSAGFEHGLDSGLQIDEGVVLSSGLAALWNNGDLRDNTDENQDRLFENYEEPGDPELQALVAGFKTFDAAALEFDVFCTHGQLEIDYQFGSEEYDKWVGDFNDAFLVTIDGVATSFVPDCSDIVAVSSVNAVLPSNEHLYLDDDLDIAPTVAPGYEEAQVEYNGMTIRLRIHAFVTPNRNHRVRLVIADVNDDLLDSALLVGSVRTLSPRR